MPRHMPQSTVDRQQFAEKESEKNVSVVFIFISLQSILKSTLFCHLCPFFSTPSLKLKGESLFKKFFSSYFEKCPSKHAAMCPSEHEICGDRNMKLELRNKGSPLQLAPKPTHT